MVQNIFSSKNKSKSVAVQIVHAGDLDLVVIAKMCLGPGLDLLPGGEELFAND